MKNETGDMRNTYINLFEEHEVKIKLGRPKRRWQGSLI
jgi:hypothetical protein